MYRPEGVSDDLGVLVRVGLGGLVGSGVGSVIGVETGVGVDVGSREVAVDVEGLTGVEIGDWDSAGSAAFVVGVCGAVCVGLGVRMDAEILLQAYDDIEQHEQITQAMKKRVT